MHNFCFENFEQAFIKSTHSFEVHSNESVCKKKVRLRLEQVIGGLGYRGDRSVDDKGVREELAGNNFGVHIREAYI